MGQRFLYPPLDFGVSAFPCVETTGDPDIDFGSDASLDDLIDAAMTVDLWINVNDTATVKGFISKGSYSANAGWYAFLSTTHTILFRVYDNTSTANQATSAALAGGEWNHVAMMFNDGGNRKPRVAVNGTWGTAAGAHSNPVSADAAYDLEIGHQAGSAESVWPFAGKVGWLRISNNDRYSGDAGTAFTPPGRGTPPATDVNTVELWKFDEGTGTNLAAQVASPTNDGTMNANWAWVIE